MAATTSFHMRIEPKVKAQAAKLFRAMGLTLSQGVSIYLHKAIRSGRVPFDLSVPDKESLRVLAKAKAGKGLHEVANAKELFRKLDK